MILSLLLSCYFSNPAFPGTESGGGGGVVWIKSQPILMDFFTMVDSVDELPVTPKEEASRIDVDSDVISINAKNVSDIQNSNKAFYEASRILNHWSGLPFDILNLTVDLAMRSPLRWKFVDENLQAPPFYLSPSIPSGSEVETVAFYRLYSDKDVEVLINRSIWNQMDLNGQAGLLIHEALRQVQIGYGHGFDDQGLQRATAIYLMCNPTRRLNYYMFYVLTNSPAQADNIYGPFRKFMASECKRIK